MRRAAFAILAALMIGSAAFIVATVGQLPGEVASHFGRAGVDDWTARSDYLLWMLALALIAPAAVVSLIALLPRIAPHRAYWLSEAQRDQTLASLFAFACWQGCVLTAFAAGLHWVIIDANAASPPRLSAGLFIALLVLFLAAMVAWTAALYARFRTMH
jgi:hypothetical protein